MKNIFASSCWLSMNIILTVCLTLIGFPALASDKMRPEDVVTKHLESVGAEETRASIHNRIVAGTVVFTVSAPSNAKFDGDCILASEGNKNMIAMAFGGNAVQEKFAFDGSKLTAGSPRPGSRGFWGDFLLTHDNIVKHGLVGGVLSDSWPLFNLSDKKQSLEYRGTKKIDGKTSHEVAYIPRGSSDLKIVLFFDSETFQHVRSEYTRTISAGLGSATTLGSGVRAGAQDASGQQRPTRYKMVEEFGDFKKEGGLSLPHNYKVTLEFDTRGGTQVVNWVFTLNGFAFNQPLPPATFSAKAN
ncbi:MAG: hypothetical protein ACT4OT_01395 [Acidobacteriota bacterium]